MEQKQELKKNQKLEVIEDGLQTRKMIETRKLKMEQIKTDKLDMLKQSNIAEDLAHDLVRQKITA